MWKKMRAALVAMLAVLALSGAIVAIDASPAAAAYSDCPSGQVGVFRDVNGGNGSTSPGHDCIAFSTHPVGQCFGFVPAFDNVASSVNNTFGNNHGIYFYSDGHCDDATPLYVPAGKRADDLSGWYWIFPTTWNDRASSFSVA